MSNRKTIQILITEECNLRCKYCFEINKSNKVIELALVKEILDKEIHLSSQHNEIFIDLSGGESLLHFHLIKNIVSFCESRLSSWNKTIHIMIGTNLTLINDEIKNWLRSKESLITLGVSLDGIPKAHNYYRNNSYALVYPHLEFYRTLYPSQPVKMTIGKETLKYLYESALHIESLGLKYSANVVYEDIWGGARGKENSLMVFEEQLNLLVEHYIENPHLDVPNLLSLPIHLITSSNNAKIKWCGAGTDMVAYDTEGNQFPCHRYTDFCLGKQYTHSNKSDIATKCEECIFYNACPSCSAFNWQIYGHSDVRTTYHCEFIKLQLLATSKLIYFKNRENLIKKDISTSTLRNIKAISIIQESLAGAVL